MPHCTEVTVYRLTEISPYDVFTYAQTFNLRGSYSVLHKKGKSDSGARRGKKCEAHWHISC